MNETIEQQQDAEVERYLKNRMSADEKAQFEIRMLEEPELLERVQLIDALQAELQATPDLLLADTTDSHTESNAAILPFRTWLRQPLSLAASLLLAIFAAYQVYDAPGENDAFTTIPIRSLVLLEATRGGTVTRMEAGGPYLLQIDAGLDAGTTSFELSISSDDGEVLVEEPGLNADSNGWVRVLLNELPAGEYRVALRWQDPQGTAQIREYAIRFGN